MSYIFITCYALSYHVVFWQMMFGTTTFGGTSLFGSSATATTNHNPMKDIEVPSPPDDSVSVLAFSPGTLQTTFLAAGSWDNNVCSFGFLSVFCKN